MPFFLMLPGCDQVRSGSNQVKSGCDFYFFDVADGDGKESTAGQVKLCSRPGVEEGEMQEDACGAQSSKVYCMEVAAMDFKEADMVQHTLGSTCAPLYHTRLRPVEIAQVLGFIKHT